MLCFDGRREYLWDGYLESIARGHSGFPGQLFSFLEETGGEAARTFIDL